MVIIALMTPMSQFPGNSLLYRDGNTEGNQNHEGDNCDAVVAKEGKDEGEGEKPKENMGEEVNWSLKPIKQAWLPIHWPISIRTCSNPPFAATLNRIRIYVCFPFESFLIWKKTTLVMETTLAVTPTNWKYLSISFSAGPRMNWIKSPECKCKYFENLQF